MELEQSSIILQQMAAEFIGCWRENKLAPAEFETPRFICKVTDKSFTFSPKEEWCIPTHSDINAARIQIVNHLATKCDLF